MPELTPPNEVPVFKRHDWSAWADGQWRTFYPDVDFPGQTLENFRQSGRKYALRHNLNFSGIIDKHRKRVLIQMWPKGKDQPRVKGGTIG
jgi:hypothetical protein